MLECGHRTLNMPIMPPLLLVIETAQSDVATGSLTPEERHTTAESFLGPVIEMGEPRMMESYSTWRHASVRLAAPIGLIVR